MRREQEHQASEELRESLPAPLKRCMDLAQEKGASSWLTSMPIEEFGLSGCSRTAVQLGTTTHSIHLRLWHKILGETCSLLPKRWFSFHQT